MKRILLSLAVIAITASVASGAAYAYFTSTKVLGANSFTAGTVIVDVVDGSGNTFVWNETNMAPGYDVTKVVKIKNVGSLPITASVSFALTDVVKNSANEDLSEQVHVWYGSTDLGTLKAYINAHSSINVPGTIGVNSDLPVSIRLTIPSEVTAGQGSSFKVNVSVVATQSHT